MNNQKNEISFDFAPNVKIGSIFSRIDRNGKKWIAEVIDRTEYFVNVKKTQPYQIKVANDDISGQLGCWHYEDAPPTFERAQICEDWEEVETEEVDFDLYGDPVPVKKRVPSGKFYIKIKEEYSKFSNYDKVYSLEC